MDLISAFIFAGMFGIVVALITGLKKVNDSVEYNKSKTRTLNREIKYLKKQWEEQKPKKLYKVEIERYVNGETRTTIVPKVVRTEEYGEVLIIYKPDGHYIVDRESIITLEMTEI